MRSDSDRLSDILEAIARLKSGSRIAWLFKTTRCSRSGLSTTLQVIGEAARGVSQPMRGQHLEVPWPQIVALRNILVHEYFGLNLDQIWTMTQKDLPKLIRAAMSG
jgi:uncharacterized protein with HEPN domain